jgi:hypothetical protein
MQLVGRRPWRQLASVLDDGVAAAGHDFDG